MRKRPLIAIVAAAVLLSASPVHAQERPARRIALCCAWGSGIEDGITYSITAPTARLRTLIGQGIQSWAEAVNATPGLKHKLVLTEVTRKAEVVVRVNRAGTNIQGQTRHRGDRDGWIAGASILVFASLNGKPSPDVVIGQIAKHEFGHALGLGHADGAGAVMSPTLVDGKAALTACDVAAARSALGWWLMRGADEPSDPPLSTRC